MSLEEFGQRAIEFVQVHEAWTAPIVFALAFGESLAFVSLVLPSWAALVGIGAIMRAGGVAFVPIWIAGAIGAALGDWLSYWIGTRFKRSIVAGVLGMPYRTFQLANFSSAFVWAAVLLKLGDVGAAISTWLWNDVVGKFWM